MNIGNITSDNFNLDSNGKDIQIEVYEQLIEQLQQENKQLKEKLDKYENPEDMTLFAMWCTEKVKDENKKLKKQLEESKNIKNKLLVYNASIKGNWNKLKEFLKNTRKENLEWDKKHNCEWQGYNAYYELLIKMQELEQGDSNEI